MTNVYLFLGREEKKISGRDEIRDRLHSGLRCKKLSAVLG
jgi:hypothetical protein